MLIGIVSCSSSTTQETTSVTITTGNDFQTLSRGVLGVHTDMDIVVLDVKQDNTYYAKAQPFEKIGNRWSVTIENLPVGAELEFLAYAYNNADVVIFEGYRRQSLVLPGNAGDVSFEDNDIYLNLFPLSDGDYLSVPKITSIVANDNGIILNIEDKLEREILFSVTPDVNSFGFTLDNNATDDNTTDENPTTINGIVTLDEAGKGSVLLNYKKFKVGSFIHNITLNNQLGGVLDTVFTTEQSSQSDIIIGIAPAIVGVQVTRRDTLFQVQINTVDDGNESELTHTWVYSPNENTTSITMENDSVNPVIFNDFGDDVNGTLYVTVRDAGGLEGNYTYKVASTNFPTNESIFSVASTSVDNGVIGGRDSVQIEFTKSLDESSVNADSIFISNGIRPIAGTLSVNDRNITFTPENDWNDERTYILNIKANLRDYKNNGLSDIRIIEFGVGGLVRGRSCKDALDKNPRLKDGVYQIDPDGDGENEAFEVYCDMTTDGGGWTLLDNRIPHQSGQSCYAGYGTIDDLGLWKIKPNYGNHGGSSRHGGCGISTTIKLPMSEVKLINSSLDGARNCGGVYFSNPTLQVVDASTLDTYDTYYYPGWSWISSDAVHVLSKRRSSENWSNQTYLFSTGYYYVHFGSGSYSGCSRYASETGILIR